MGLKSHWTLVRFVGKKNSPVRNHLKNHAERSNFEGMWLYKAGWNS